MARSGEPNRFDWKAFLLLCAIFLVVAFLWETPWVYPLKLLVVFLHEISHGLAAIFTGGRIAEIQVQQGEGGHALTVGGNGPLIYSAGYLGSMLFGVVLMLVAARTRAQRPVAALLGALLAIVAIRFVPFAENTFGKLFGIAVGALLISLAQLPRAWASFGLQIVGVTSCLYAVLDIKSDVLDRPGADSDAVRLAEMTGIPAILWGAIWIVVSLAVTAGATYLAVTGHKVDSPPRAKR